MKRQVAQQAPSEGKRLRTTIELNSVVPKNKIELKAVPTKQTRVQQKKIGTKIVTKIVPPIKLEPVKRDTAAESVPLIKLEPVKGVKKEPETLFNPDQIAKPKFPFNGSKSLAKIDVKVEPIYKPNVTPAPIITTDIVPEATIYDLSKPTNEPVVTFNPDATVYDLSEPTFNDIPEPVVTFNPDAISLPRNLRKIEKSHQVKTPKSVSNSGFIVEDLRKPSPDDSKVLKGICIQISAPKPTETEKDPNSWATRYAPLLSQELVGNTQEIERVRSWLQAHKVHRSTTKPILILNGPCGIGKTTIPHIIAKEVGFDVQEFNTLHISKDFRSKNSKESAPNFMKDVVQTRVRNNYGKPLVIFIDGGDIIGSTSHYSFLIKELAKERDAKGYTTKQKDGVLYSVRHHKAAPIIISVNNFGADQLKPLKKKVRKAAGNTDSYQNESYQYIELVNMKPLQPDDIKTRLAVICQREQIGSASLDLIARTANGDMCRAINILQICCTFLGKPEKMLARAIDIIHREYVKTLSTAQLVASKRQFGVDDGEDSENPLFKVYSTLEIIWREDPSITALRSTKELEVSIGILEKVVGRKYIRANGKWRYEPSSDRSKLELVTALEYLRHARDVDILGKKEMLISEVESVCYLFAPALYNPKIDRTLEKLFQTKLSLQEIEEQLQYSNNRQTISRLVPENTYRALENNYFQWKARGPQQTKEMVTYLERLENISECMSTADLISTAAIKGITDSSSTSDIIDLYSSSLPILLSKGPLGTGRLPKVEQGDGFGTVSWKNQSYSCEGQRKAIAQLSRSIWQPDLFYMARVFATTISSWTPLPTEKNDKNRVEYFKRISGQPLHKLREWTFLFDLVTEDDQGKPLSNPYYPHKVPDDEYPWEQTIPMIRYFREVKLEAHLNRKLADANILSLDLVEEHHKIEKEFEIRKDDFVKMLVCLGYTAAVYEKMVFVCFRDSYTYQDMQVVDPKTWVPDFEPNETGRTKNFSARLEGAWSIAKQAGFSPIKIVKWNMYDDEDVKTVKKSVD